MAEYKVFNDNNVAVRVTDADLDGAVVAAGPVPSHIANASAIARRRELAPRLQQTLVSSSRTQKLVASHALLALGDTSAIPKLSEAAATEADPIVSNMFRAVAIRLAGPDAAQAYFTSLDGDPKVKTFLIALYSSHLALAEGDVPFMISALRSYLDKDQPWIAAEKKDTWATRVDTIVTRLAADEGKALLAKSPLRPDLLRVLALADSLPLPRDTKHTAKKLTTALS